MKKLIFIVCMLFVTMTTYAQTTMSSYKNQVGFWNTYAKKYDWQELKYADIKIVFAKSYVKFYDQADSFYTILKANEKEKGYTNDAKPQKYESYSWDAIDEENRKVFIMVIFYENDNEFITNIMYNDRVFRYYLVKNNGSLDNF